MVNILSKTAIKYGKTMKKLDFQKGFSLIEIIIVVAILAILGTLLFAGATRQISKARDATRKDDLQDIKIAFEDYYNDYQCYPDPTVMENCGSEELQPYLREIPCDPEDGLPYVSDSLNGNACSGYRILVQIENTNDRDIELIGCSFITGCGYVDTTYNYGIASGTTLTSDDWPVPTPTPTGVVSPTPTGAPTPTPTPLAGGVWVISPDGTCAYYTDDYYPTAGCLTSYPTYDACFAVSGCFVSCTEDDVPLALRCLR